MTKISLCDTYLRGKLLSYKDFIFVEENKIIFSACNYNGLYQYNLQNEELKFLGSFINENLLMKSLHSKIVQFEQFYVFIPYYAKTIGIYDLKKELFFSMELPFPHYACHFGGKFQTAEWYKDKLYLFPESYSYILQVDFKHKQLHVYDDWNKEKLIYQSNVESGFGKGCLVDKYLFYLPLKGCNKILEFNLETKKHRFIDAKIKCTGFEMIAYINGVFYAVDRKGKIISFHINGEDMNVAGQYNTTFCQYVVVKERYLILFSNDEDAILVLDTKNGEKEYHKIRNSSEDVNFDNWEFNRIWFVKKVNDRKIVFMNREDRALKIIDNEFRKENNPEYWKAIIDNTGHADQQIELFDLYRFWVEYHDQVTHTLRYRKPFIINEKFNTKDTLGFVFDITDNRSFQDNQMDGNKQNMGFAIWEGLK